jgi:D-alanyl-D-alanine carboxypeptidase/D-alanyl-D-alanine-endopeptidase (penicillin-binding protein 4)
VPALKYVEKSDSLIFWGTGDPSFLYSEVYQNTRVFDFLKNSKHNLYFSSSNFHQEHFGPGWAWDDYNYSYSPERSPLPIYGNCLSITDSIDNKLIVTPSFFQQGILVSEISKPKKTLVRALDGNGLNFFPGSDNESYSGKIPFRVSPDLVASLLTDTLHRDVKVVKTKMPTNAQIVFSIPTDSLYKVMMQESDNFIAEQLLQMCAGVLSDSLNSAIAIKAVKENYLFDLPDEPRWVDGSGLSRYNLFTPRSIVRLWEKLLTLVPQQRLFQLLAIGGKAGTIKDSYKSDTPFIFGKTGTLSNNHCLSGYLVTKTGSVLIFSFMNNNYTVPTSMVRGKMESILLRVHERY